MYVCHKQRGQDHRVQAFRVTLAQSKAGKGTAWAEWVQVHAGPLRDTPEFQGLALK